MTEPRSRGIPPRVLSILNGADLEEKVGHTFLLTACGPDGWPHLALLSVGEVLAFDATNVGLVLHEGTGTARSLRGSGQGLLVVIADGRACRMRLRVPVERDRRVGDDPSALFFAQVEQVAEDSVDYAYLLHGIEFALTDPDATVATWQAKLATLREARAG